MTDFRGRDLRNADLSGADLREANLEGVDLSGATLADAKLYGANLRGCTIAGGSAVGAQFFDATLADATIHGADFNYAKFIGADLTGAKLVDVLLRGAMFRNAILAGATIAGCDAARAVFETAELRQAFIERSALDGASLNSAHIDHAVLRDVRLNGASLLRAVISTSTLTRVDFTNAAMGGTTIGGTSLADSVGLATILHHGPSSIGVDTLQASGRLPRSFLRDVGLPDALAERFSDDVLVPESLSCFLSHSSADYAFVRRLYDDLKAANVRVWYAEEDLEPGAKLVWTFDEKIRGHDRLLLVLSASAIGSGWVQSEVATALTRERIEKRDILIPVRIDDTVMDEEHDSWARPLRDGVYILDFTQWEDAGVYRKTLARLLRALRKQPM